MSESRTPLIRPLGLITTPGKYGEYAEGALRVANYVVMRDAGRLTPAPFPHAYGQVGAQVGNSARAGIALDAGHMYTVTQGSGAFTHWQLWHTLSGVSNNVTLPDLMNDEPGSFSKSRIFPVRARDRMLINSNRGVLVGDYMTPSNATERAVRYAGLPQPTVSVGILLEPTGEGALPAGYGFAHRVCFARRLQNDYVIRSMPSPAFKCGHEASVSTDDTIQRLFVRVQNIGLQPGDIIEVYRTDAVQIATATWDPGMTFKLVMEHVITAADLLFPDVILIDAMRVEPPYYQTIGRELYTNPFQEGELAANLQPEICYAQETFREYVFWANVLERPVWEFQPRGSFNGSTTSGLVTPAEREFGIGIRRGPCAATVIGNPTVSGVSATDMLGIKVGQFWYSGVTGFPLNATVISVGATSFTMSANATSVVSFFGVQDRVEVTGFGSFRLFGPGTMATDLGFGGGAEVTTNQTLNRGYDLNIPGIGFTMRPARPSGQTSFTVRATNGANYSPPVEEWNSGLFTPFAQTARKNILRWSKNSEPEHAPSANETFVGNGEIISLLQTKEALWIACTDGFYRLTGYNGSWIVDGPLDPKCVLAAPQAWANMGEQVFAYTNYGFVLITDGGIQRISEHAIRDLMPGASYSSESGIWVRRNDINSEVVVCLAETQTPTPYNSLYVYNWAQKCFTSLPDWGNITFSGWTTAFYQQYPASGEARLVFATRTAGSHPTLRAWRQAGETGFYLPPYVQYQPLHLGDPLTRKQWIDCTLVFDSLQQTMQIDTGLVDRIGALTVVCTNLSTKEQSDNDVVATFGIPRFAAMGGTIAPAWNRHAAAVYLDTFAFLGLSLRYVPLTYQPENR